jgi:hypothetical protein
MRRTVNYCDLQWDIRWLWIRKNWKITYNFKSCRLVSSFCPVLCLFCCSYIYLYILYIYDLFHILLLPLRTFGSMACVYIYVCMYVCMYVCSCVRDWIRRRKRSKVRAENVFLHRRLSTSFQFIIPDHNAIECCMTYGDERALLNKLRNN